MCEGEWPSLTQFHCLELIGVPSDAATRAQERYRIACALQYPCALILRGIVMATYVVLAKFTDQGIRTIKNSPQRASQVAEMAKSFDCEMREIYWTLGQYDLVTIVDAKDEQSLAAFGYSLGSAGNVRSQTLRAFTKDEIEEVISRLP
jgi:uncharacterized protein with GYD domain